jgi:molybdopterin converting factor small subunit
MATVLFFGPARDAAGARSAIVDGASVGDVVAATAARYGEGLANLLPTCRVWLNGDPVTPDTPVGADDEVAVLPPVSGG